MARNGKPRGGGCGGWMLGCLVVPVAFVGCLALGVDGVNNERETRGSGGGAYSGYRPQPTSPSPPGRSPAENLAIIDGRSGEVGKYRALLSRVARLYGEDETRLSDRVAGVQSAGGGTCWEALKALEAAR